MPYEFSREIPPFSPGKARFGQAEEMIFAVKMSNF